MHEGADWYLLVGDMTALPAISGNLELMPHTARGTAVIEVMDEADIQDLQKPSQLEIEWVIYAQPGHNGDLLVERARSLPWQDGDPSVWATCEYSSMRKLRAYFRGDRALDSSNLYISSYWKAGSNEDSHRIAKRQDATAAA